MPPQEGAASLCQWDSPCFLCALSHFDNIHNCKPLIHYLKPDIETGKGQTVCPLWIPLIGGTWIVGEHSQQGLALIKGNLIQKCFRNMDRQKIGIGVVCEAAKGIGMGVAIGNVGFDIKDWGAIHQICAAYMEHGSEFPGFLHLQQTDTGQAKTVGAEGGACSEYAHAGVAPQSRRAHRR